ncbi:MAG TPA: zinc dependent phospholipase C family protein [Methanotrichaceae archaeon]|nr:zinc dependent phospholipase C family protein [Methanotrichaceae archaeon]
MINVSRNNISLTFKLSIVILIALPLTIGLSSAWNSGHDKTHELIAAKLYSDMPDNIKKNLDLSEMKAGADYPDKLDAGDKRRHAYPLSVDYAEKNLKKAISDYHDARNAKTPQDRKKYYREESFHLGMATHYIADTFAAPHTMSKMDHHDQYYKTADGIKDIQGARLPQEIWTLDLKSRDGLDALLKYGKREGNKDAQYWNDNRIWEDHQKASKLATGNLKLAYAGTLAVFKQWLGF